MGLNTDELKAKVLDLAIRGKLVDSRKFSGESGMQLIERILKEREKRTKVVNSSKNKNFDYVTNDEIPFEVPNHWGWTKLDCIAQFIDYRGKTPKKTEYGIPLITAKNIRLGFIDKFPEEFIAESDYDSWMTRGIPNHGNVVFTTEAPLANVGRLLCENKYALAQRAIVFKTYITEIDSYLLYLLMSTSMRELIFERATGTTVLGIKASKLKQIVIPIPPLEEQLAIVNRIEELFKIIDNLSSEADLQLKSLDQLRQKTLDLAIRGKLVLQDENDEPASELLKRIKAEKDQMVKEKKIKKPANLKPISEDEIPFEIPEGWIMTRLGDIIELISGRDESVEVCNADGLGIPYIMGASNIENNTFTPERWIETPKVVSEIGDFIITVKGTVGKYFVNDIGQLNLSRQTMAFRLSEQRLIKYLEIWFNYYVETLKEQSQGLIPGVSREELLNSLLPIPPLEEQFRIVQKLESIMFLIKSSENVLKRNIETIDNIQLA